MTEYFMFPLSSRLSLIWKNRCCHLDHNAIAVPDPGRWFPFHFEESTSLKSGNIVSFYEHRIHFCGQGQALSGPVKTLTEKYALSAPHVDAEQHSSRPEEPLGEERLFEDTCTDSCRVVWKDRTLQKD